MTKVKPIPCFKTREKILVGKNVQLKLVKLSLKYIVLETTLNNLNTFFSIPYLFGIVLPILIEIGKEYTFKNITCLKREIF